MSELLHLDVFETKEEIKEVIATLEVYISRLEQRLEDIEDEQD